MSKQSKNPKSNMIEEEIKEKWLRSVCTTPSELIDFFQERFKMFQNVLARSADTLSLIEKHVMAQSIESKDSDESIVVFEALREEVSKLQIQFVQERRNYLCLVETTEQYKLENLDLKRKFHAALLLGKVEEKDVKHFILKNPNSKTKIDKMIKLQNQLKSLNAEGSESEEDAQYVYQNPVVMSQQVDFLQRHIDDLNKQNRKEIYTLEKAVREAQEDRELFKNLNENKIKELQEKLSETNKLLLQGTQENVDLQIKLLQQEEIWSKEKKKLTMLLENSSPLDMYHYESDYLPISRKPSSAMSLKNSEKILLQKLSRTENEVLEKSNLIEEYKMKIVKIERKIAELREKNENERRTYKDLSKKLKNNNEILQNRYENLEKRRKRDNEGFRNDLKEVKSQVGVMEREYRIFELRVLAENVLNNNNNIPPEIPPAEDNLAVHAEAANVIGESRRSGAGAVGVTLNERLTTVAGTLFGQRNLRNRGRGVTTTTIDANRNDVEGDQERLTQIVQEMAGANPANRQRLHHEYFGRALRAARQRVHRMEHSIE